MSNNNYETNWDQFEIDLASSQYLSDHNDRVFATFKEGYNRVRIIPTGNYLRQSPMLEVKQHNFEYYKDGAKLTPFVNCWSFIQEDFAKLSPEDKKSKSILSYMSKNKTIDTVEFQKFQTHGCPFCKFKMDSAALGIDKEAGNRFYPNTKYWFNILHKEFTDNKGIVSGDNKVHIWSVSGKIKEAIKNEYEMHKQLGINIFDTETGFDLIYIGSGQGILRRYDVKKFPTASKLEIENKTTYDLVEMFCRNHKSYQEVVNLFKIQASKLVQAAGYIVAGDETAHLKAAVVPSPPPNIPQVSTQEEEFIGATLYDKDGVELF